MPILIRLNDARYTRTLTRAEIKHGSDYLGHSERDVIGHLGLTDRTWLSGATDITDMLTEKNFRFAFDASLWLKGVFALSELIAGIATHLVSQQFLLSAVLWITKDEFAEDPRDVVANYLLRSVQHLSVSDREFASIYLLGHGAVKLALIVGLLRTRLWCYPVALVVFGLFVVYQIYRFTFTHSVLLSLVTGLDVIVIVLIWHEWRYLANRP